SLYRDRAPPHPPPPAPAAISVSDSPARDQSRGLPLHPARAPPQSPSVILHLRGESREPPRSDAQQRAHRVDVERLPLALQGHDTLIHDIESITDRARELEVLLDQQDRTAALLPDPP